VSSPGNLRHIFTKVAGVSYRNHDGTSRQKIIPRCRAGELLRLEHEPDNPHDINAIRILRQDGGQIGYLPRELAGEVVSRSARGWGYHAVVAGIGRSSDSGLNGASLLLVITNDDVGDDAVRVYAARVLGGERAAVQPRPDRTARRLPHWDDKEPASHAMLWIAGVAIVTGIGFGWALFFR
jgi:hypothetical protein